MDDCVHVCCAITVKEWESLLRGQSAKALLGNCIYGAHGSKDKSLNVFCVLKEGWEAALTNFALRSESKQ